MQGEPPTQASTPAGAVFLSYASQDAEVAKRICEALRAAGIVNVGAILEGSVRRRSEAVAQSAIETAEGEIRAIERMQPAKEEKDTARIIRMLPRAALVLRERIRGGNLGLRDPRSIVQGRNTLFAMFGGKVPLRPAQVRPGEKPYLIARVGLNRAVLLQAAGSCVEFGSGARLRSRLLCTGCR